jgi:hypothetical protein
MRSGHQIHPKPGEDYISHLAQHDATMPIAQKEGWADRLSLHMGETVTLALEEQPQLAQGMQAPNFTRPPGPNGSQQPTAPVAAPAGPVPQGR